MSKEITDRNKLQRFLNERGGNIFVRFVRCILKYWKLYLLFLPAFAVLFLFNYLPLSGMLIAFKDFYPKKGIFFSPWAEPFYVNFADLFSDKKFWDVLANTLLITGTKLLVCFPAPIVLSLIFNEIKLKKFKRVVQTVLYLPHFLSWVVLAGIFRQILASDGMVNGVLSMMGLQKVGFLTKSFPYFCFVVLSDMWQNCGFASILYLAAIAAIDISQYEAARIDGANRWRVMWSITLPCLIPTIILQLVLNTANLVDGGFGQIYNTYSEPVYDVADIIDTYVYRIGISNGDIELASALGVFKSVVSLILVLVTNKISDKLTGEGVF